MSREPSYKRGDGAAGFTLIEVLVALTVVAVSLSAIGSLIATTIRGIRALDTRLELVETARSLETSLPDRDQMKPGTLTGSLGSHRWRLDVLPFLAGGIAPQAPSLWVPQTVILRAQSEGGSVLQIDTVRLLRRPSQ